MTENMKIYEAVRAVPQEAQKSFNNGRFSGTDINPMWRIKKLTEMFGPCGIGWYYEVLSERAEEHGDITIAIVDLNLHLRDKSTLECSFRSLYNDVVVLIDTDLDPCRDRNSLQTNS